MAGLLYFIPEAKASIKIEAIREAGLGYAFDAKPTPREVVGKGPSGGPGVLLADDTLLPSGRLKFAPEQTWIRIPNSPAYVGMYTAEPPTPDELRRDKMLRGHLVELGDGQRYLVPVARGQVEEDGELRYYVALPTRLIAGENGDWQRSAVVPMYARLWSIAEAWWSSLRSAEISGDADTANVEFDFSSNDFADQAEAALEALAANYRIGKAEVNLLGLFDSVTAVQILNALVDGPTVRAWTEKKNGGGSLASNARFLMFRRWAAGLDPGYRPTFADHWALAQGWGDPDPVMIENFPVAMHVLRLT